MTILSTVLIDSSLTTETLKTATGDESEHDICLFSESPHYIVRVWKTSCIVYRILVVNYCRLLEQEIRMSSND